jgi:hypothetical protein
MMESTLWGIDQWKSDCKSNPSSPKQNLLKYQSSHSVEITNNSKVKSISIQLC